jgi:hypothetical protein
MSRKGNCWDNAVAESFFSSLKKERIKKQIYKNRDLAITDVADYIETFYNRRRRHSYLGGVSPEQFEAAHELRRRGVSESWDLHPRLRSRHSRQREPQCQCACGVDNAIAAIRSYARDQLFSERPEQSPDQHALIDFGERRRHEQVCV